MTQPPIAPEIPNEDLPIIEGWQTAPVTGDRVNVFDAPIVAGDPVGARIEIRSTGFHAFNGVGTETAHIDGAEGVFVGGEFRTSDALPGQVTLSDDAYVTHFDGGGTFPGISVVPIDTTDMQLPAAIGPSERGLTIFGGRNTAGGSSIVQANPAASFMRTFREDGTIGGVLQTSPADSLMRTYREDSTTGGEIQTSPADSFMRTYSGNSLESGWVRVQPQDAELASVDATNTYVSRIKADASNAFLYTRAGGTSRFLTVNATGMWVQTNKSGSWESYNLEETAQDSGWQPFTVAAGVTPSATLAWRNKGGIIFFRGTATGAWTANTWNTIATGLDPAWRPGSSWIVNEAGASVSGAKLRMTSTGELAINPPATETRAYFLTAMTYPAG